MNNLNYKSKCDFCKYHTASGCNAKPNSWYCREAQQEFFEWLAKNKKQNIKYNKRRIR